MHYSVSDESAVVYAMVLISAPSMLPSLLHRLMKLMSLDSGPDSDNELFYSDLIRSSPNLNHSIIAPLATP